MFWRRPRAWGGTKYHAFRTKQQWEPSVCNKWFYTYQNYWDRKSDPWQGKGKCQKCKKLLTSG